MINKNSKWIIVSLVVFFVVISSLFLTQKFLFDENSTFLGLEDQRCEIKLHSKVDLHGCDLRGKEFVKADLSYANLEGAVLLGAKFIEVDLSHANLKNAQCAKTIFKKSSKKKQQETHR